MKNRKGFLICAAELLGFDLIESVMIADAVLANKNNRQYNRRRNNRPTAEM